MWNETVNPNWILASCSAVSPNMVVDSLGSHRPRIGRSDRDIP
jgi:hypothetical protein